MPPIKLTVLFAVVAASTLFFSLPSFSETNPLLEAGINAYQQGKFDDAKSSFNQLAAQNGWSFTALYDLGDIAVQQKHLGEALGYFKRALSKKPHDADTRYNLKFVEDALGPRPNGKVTNYEIFRNEVLSRFAFVEFLAASLISSAVFLSLLLTFLKKRQAVKNEDAALGLAPSPSLVIAGVLTVLLLVGSALKLVDTYSERDTVVADKVDLRSGPSDTNASMMELPEGVEVVVLDQAPGWKQVTLPGGGLAGWVPDNSVMETSGGGPW